MFRHRGKNRTLVHNLKLASLLSFVAGSVNVAGLLAVHRLTTNVTGHLAFFADEISRQDFRQAWVFLLFIGAFFGGSFFSSLMVEATLRKNVRFVHTGPILLEIMILAVIGVQGEENVETNVNLIASSLLFAMGMQNALVTTLSNSIVRTTHLTGLFTDMGIELSQLLFYKNKESKVKLKSSLTLRVTIVGFFFLGGLTGGIGYFLVGIRIFLLGAMLLLGGGIYDSARYQVVTLKRRLRR